MSQNTGWQSLGSAIGPVIERLATGRGLPTESASAQAHGASDPQRRSEGRRGAERGDAAAPRIGDGVCGRAPVSDVSLRDVLDEITATNRAMIAAAKVMTTNRPAVMTPDLVWDARIAHYKDLRARLLALKIRRAEIEGL